MHVCVWGYGMSRPCWLISRTRKREYECVSGTSRTGASLYFVCGQTSICTLCAPDILMIHSLQRRVVL